jgi:2-polyprenyl-6-methoxyphenol hydroxylase-like FAD-dependent oxidoreductase
MFRIGNAAGEAHPIIGEGMSMALQSAWLLCQHLLAPGSRAEDSDSVWQARVAQRYAAQWRRQFQTRLHLASVFAHVAMRPVLAAPLLKLAHAWPSVLTWGAVHAGKTRYVSNELAQPPAMVPTDALHAAISTPAL